MPPLHQRPDFANYRINRTSNRRRVIYLTHPKWVEALGYLLGHFLSEHELELYTGCFFFTHDHLDLGHPWGDSPTVEPRFSAFLTDFRWWCFWLLKQAGDWEHGAVYNTEERTYQGPALDAEQVWWDLIYDTAQAVTAGFFRSSSRYPGLVFQPEDVLKPRVFRRNSLIDAIDPERRVFKADVVSIRLGIPRPFRSMTREDYATEFRRRLDEYEASVANPKAKHWSVAVADCRRRKLGQKLVDDDDEGVTRRRSKPPRSSLRPQPVNSTDPEFKREYYKHRREFWAEHRLSYELLYSGAQGVNFPAGTYGWRRKLNLGSLPAPKACWDTG